MGCVCLLILIMQAIKEENENGTSEHQCVMGLSDAEFFWGHYLTALFTFLIPSCVAIAVMYFAGSKEHPYGPGMNLSLVIVSFVMFAIQGSLLTIFIMWVFPTGYMCLGLTIVLNLCTPVLLPASRATSLPGYFLLAKKAKLMTAVLPHTSLYGVLKILCIARDYEGGASWSLLTRGVLDRDNVTIGELWGVTLICIVVMAFLTWYLSSVLPWSSNTPKSPVFCLLVWITAYFYR
ncbi:uncharacterized protein LOC125941442 [Dermacentor silvarum]|uniref:uncharacterized protein LOC125941442 n=1 Tax=Dermacentor silvarum TaxID=543639 RepID=UPI0021017D46|nr:uncharacterized protein LOC125941442 [Dermacentor silvarum]